MKKNITRAVSFSLLLAGALACGGGGGSSDDPAPEDNNPDQENPQNPGEGNNPTAFTPPTTYTFPSRFNSGESAVSYTGQTARQVLIADLVSTIASLERTIDKSADDVLLDLNFYFRFDDSVGGSLDYLFSLGDQSIIPGPTYNDISSGKDLVSKIAGNDRASHILDGVFFGWDITLDDPTAVVTPENLVDYFFDVLATQVTKGEVDTVTVDGNEVDIDVVYVTETGLDLKQLVQKFLLGSVAYSQGTADYLKTDFSVANAEPDKTGKPYSTAEHKWDEAFGYFGAARNYNEYEDDEIAGKGGRAEFADGFNDANGDGDIDIRSEVNLANSTNCAKRDRGSVVETDFTADAFNAFLLGRTILNSVEGELSESDLTQLREQALIASRTWEKCIAATVVHYINEVLADMDNFTGSNDYASLAAFKNHAKHWGEMKGFGLGLQFNPDSPFRADADSVAQLQQLLSLMGDAPVLPDGTQAGVAFTGGVEQYRSDLLAARDILENIYEFDESNVAAW